MSAVGTAMASLLQNQTLMSGMVIIVMDTPLTLNFTETNGYFSISNSQ